MKYHSIWEAIPPTKHLRELCRALGNGYRIRLFDGEQVIYRDFGNGYDLEISGVNTASLRKKAILYLWKDANRIVKKVIDVPQKDIRKWAEWLRGKAEHFVPEDFGKYGYLKNEVRTVRAVRAGDGSNAP